VTAPKESWQPTPGGRHIRFRSLLARRGCTLRSALNIGARTFDATREHA
jgi:hypothetical protein